VFGTSSSRSADVAATGGGNEDYCRTEWPSVVHREQAGVLNVFNTSGMSFKVKCPKTAFF
jgi:hypothetical protein